MAFSFDGLGTLGGQGRVGNAFQAFTYKTNDTINDVLVAGYFNSNRGNFRKNDLIFIHREDIDGQNVADFVIRITQVPTNGDITSAISTSDDWTDDGSSLKPTLDGRDVDTGSGDLITNEGTFKALDASKIVHTDGNKKLVSVDIKTAYNKDLSDATPEEDTDAGDSGSSTDISRADHAHPKTNASTIVRGQVELATNTETQAGTDTERTITPAGLESKTATESRKGIAEIATQPETDAETDDTRIVTPIKLAGKKASQAEAEAQTDNVKIMTALRTKQLNDANLGITRVIAENDTTDPNNDIKFNAGRMWNDARTKILNLLTYIKRLDANFAAGNNQGMLRTGATKASNTWYDLYGIEKDSDESTDYYAEDDTSTPSHVPTGYSNPTYITSILTDGSGNVLAFKHRKNGSINWVTAPKSVNTANSGTGYQNFTLAIPPGKEVKPIFVYTYGTGSATGAIVFLNPAQILVAATDDPIDDAVISAKAGYGRVSCIYSNLSSQIRANISVDANLEIAVLGWNVLQEAQ